MVTYPVSPSRTETTDGVGAQTTAFGFDPCQRPDTVSASMSKTESPSTEDGPVNQWAHAGISLAEDRERDESTLQQGHDGRLR